MAPDIYKLYSEKSPFTIYPIQLFTTPPLAPKALRISRSQTYPHPRDTRGNDLSQPELFRGSRGEPTERGGIVNRGLWKRPAAIIKCSIVLESDWPGFFSSFFHFSPCCPPSFLLESHASGQRTPADDKIDLWYCERECHRSGLRIVLMLVLILKSGSNTICQECQAC